MKPILILLLFIISIPFASKSQNNTEDKIETIEVEYSYKTKDIKKLEKDYASKNKGIKINVTGIHSTLHKVSVEFEDFSWESTPPEALEVLFPGFDDFQLLTNDTDGPELFPNKAKPMDYENQVDTLIEVQKKINEIKNDLATSFDKNGELDSNKVAKACGNTLEEVTKLIGAEDEKEVLATINYKIHYLLTYYEKLVESSKNLTPGKDNDVFLEIAKYNWSYQILKKNKSKIINGVLVLLSNDETSEVNSTYTTKNAHFPKKEATTVKIYIIDRFNPSDTLVEFQQDIYRTGKLLVDFSAGIGVNTLVDPTFYIGKKDTIPFIAEEEKRDVDLTVFALLHLKWKLTSWFALGPSTGVSVSVFDAKPTYLLGGSFTFGKKNTISLSGGVSMGKVDILSRSVSTNGEIADLELAPGISEVPTYGKIGFGAFACLTYNFGRIKKK